MYGKYDEVMLRTYGRIKVEFPQKHLNSKGKSVERILKLRNSSFEIMHFFICLNLRS